MSNFVCPTCEKDFQRKESLNYHISHKACKKRGYVCKYCDKSFTTSTNMYRHMKHSCNVKKEDDTEKENILERLLLLEEANKALEKKSEKQIATLKRENKVLKKKVTKLELTAPIQNKTINNRCTTNINKGTVNNIILVGYGKEDLSKLNKAELLKALQGGYYSTVKLTEAVHFNPKHPEYHNVYISNMKDKYAMMFDGKQWTLTIKEDLINQIYEDKKNYIEENLEEFVDSLPISRKKALQRWLETDDDDPKIKEIKENLKLLLYNSRKLVHEDQKVPVIREESPKVTVKKKSKSVKSIKDD
ncbi:hypothetical protein YASMINEVIRUS_1592 [Yasminevirus sp. GU-2018]|uniref:C2H2-type domain-containing protein n=1 Tax=Yasminevirus sp. GU-2018 TaxID=2420051 RepID=A0A5K0UBN0_9VIRU|nr:hypothetical protein YASMINEVIRUS_1592 [Yasminevirus sp. GU-2018]